MQDNLENKTRDELIGEYIKNLDPKMHELISSSSWGNEMKIIGKKYITDPGLLNIFYEKVWFVILGMIELDAYKQALKEELGLQENKASELEKEVADKIFTDFENKINIILAEKQKVASGERIPGTPLEEKILKKPFVAQPSRAKVDGNKKDDPYLEPIEESDTI